MEKIKTLQEKMDHEKQEDMAFGATQATPQQLQQRQQLRNEQDSNLKHMIMLAKFHNFMSNFHLNHVTLCSRLFNLYLGISFNQVIEIGFALIICQLL